MLPDQKKPYLKTPNFWIFIVLLLFSFFSYTAKGNLKLRTIRSISTIILFPLQKTISFSTNLFTLHRQNTELRRRISISSLEIQRCSNIRKENKILRELHGFKPLIDFNFISCEIIGKNPGLYNKSIIIDRGSKDGIEKNMPVISENGLVGKVIETTYKTSELLTLYHRNLFVSAMNLRSRVQGIVTWNNSRYLTLDNVVLHSDIKIGDTLVTSGMGGVFPKGIFIGQVHQVTQSPQEIVMNIKLVPFADISLLEDVFVITESDSAEVFSFTSVDTITDVMVKIVIPETNKKPEIFSTKFMEKENEGFLQNREIESPFITIE